MLPELRPRKTKKWTITDFGSVHRSSHRAQAGGGRAGRRVALKAAILVPCKPKLPEQKASPMAYQQTHYVLQPAWGSSERALTATFVQDCTGGSPACANMPAGKLSPEGSPAAGRRAVKGVCREPATRKSALTGSRIAAIRSVEAADQSRQVRCARDPGSTWTIGT